jgi:WD40 repeat protein
VSGSRDHKLRIWDFRTLTLRHTMTGHEGSVLCLQVKYRALLTANLPHPDWTYSRSQFFSELDICIRKKYVR